MPLSQYIGNFLSHYLYRQFYTLLSILWTQSTPKPFLSFFLFAHNVAKER